MVNKASTAPVHPTELVQVLEILENAWITILCFEGLKSVSLFVNTPLPQRRNLFLSTQVCKLVLVFHNP